MPTQQKKKANSIFPSFPRETQIADSSGDVTEPWQNTFGSLFQALNRNIRNEGIVLPPLDIEDINNFQAIYTPYIGTILPKGLRDPSGQTIFDTTNRVPKIFIITYNSSNPPTIIDASWKTFTLTP